MCSNRRTIFSIAERSESAGISRTWRQMLSFRSIRGAGLLQWILSFRKPHNQKLQRQLLYKTINVKRCCILHENDALNASTLLKLRDYKIPQHITVPCPVTESHVHSTGSVVIMAAGTGHGTAFCPVTEQVWGFHIQLSLQKNTVE
ncbi:hypothetical protein AVEN_94162-1 [Araneus ventricosus]|uniref:Uncharacterized protein n=1 Tax=Araneus ventricosus TaxID=182803 RepID=A0A4Y2CE41_ARAVE|nr:hypothetical protein AVEN_98305-1 [Araneus ventricosus]GBM02745.1 hypothetical protein AVEN_122885-1 [Araneus ventricosus]GBM02781.1 hypothetical protein AVEN_252623-1 [Araneus ventricosus]GBM02789.1 hypothetical protein AVEN_94162-1 [Araneus ventricosus]